MLKCYLRKWCIFVLSELADERRLVGIKQCTKAVEDGSAQTAYVAEGVAPDICEPFLKLCREKGVAVVRIATKEKLGELCRIDVAASVAVVLK